MPDRKPRSETDLPAVNRRHALLHVAGASAAAMSAALTGTALTSAHAEEPAENAATVAADNGRTPVIQRGRIKQSIVHWCFKPYWTIEQTAKIARDLGCQSVELIPPEEWPLLKKMGLVCAIAGSHGFVKGLNDPANWDECLGVLRKRIDDCATFGFPSVITFTGMAGKLSPEEGAANCVAGLKKIVGYAEEKKVTLCLEMLNSRVSTHPMKGHPGYQGDHTEYCIDIIRRVGSPRLKLLFDVYHVQIMDGDVIARIRQHAEHIGHVHTAGNPGRGELNDKQEINYKPIMEALVDVGYEGYVGQEFIPTTDPLAGLREALTVCDV